MDHPASSSALGIAFVVAGLFLAFLPVIIITSRGSAAIRLAAFLLCILSILTLSSGSITGAAISGLTFFIALPLAAALWFAGLICALVAWIDYSNDRRTREMTLRLLINDARGLGRPEDYGPQKPWWGK